jgi:hypothetical protein
VDIAAWLLSLGLQLSLGSSGPLAFNVRSSVGNATGSNFPKTVYKIQRIHDLHADAIAVKLRIRATPFSELTAKPNRNDRILTINCQVTERLM